jgi:hypothetical protein
MNYHFSKFTIYVATKRYILSFLMMILSATLHAQFLELGVTGGACSYIGDVNSKGFFNNTKVGGGFFARWNWHPNFSTRISGVRGTLQADDTRSSESEVRARNLSFNTDLWEIALFQEFNLIPYHPKKNKNQIFAPYIYAGISAFHFNPKTLYQGDWLPLQPLGTEGQGLPGFKKKYSLWQPAVVLGGGIRLALTERFAVGLDLGYRITFTDYIDDVSTVYVAPRDLTANGTLAVALSNRSEEYTGIPADNLVGERRGNSNNKDSYLFWGVTFSFHFYGKKAFSDKKPEYHIYKWF